MTRSRLCSNEAIATPKCQKTHERDADVNNPSYDLALHVWRMQRLNGRPNEAEDQSGQGKEHADHAQQNEQDAKAEAHSHFACHGRAF